MRRGHGWPRAPEEGEPPAGRLASTKRKLDPMKLTRPIAGRQLPRRRPPRCTRPALLQRIARDIPVGAIIALAPLLAAAYLATHLLLWALS